MEPKPTVRKADADSAQLAPGHSVGPYRLEALIGEGGMGQVFRALDTRLQRTVAIKFLLPEHTAGAANKRRFMREAQAASALNHPNIVALYDISSHDGHDFLVME
jgi:serine/threonine protein kinase